MKMTFRWYGEGNDKISLSDIKQIPGVDGIVWALHHKMPGEIWEEEEIAEVKRQLDQYGFNMDVIESINVHDDIKIGLPTRDKYIENYKQCIRNVAKFGVKVICYNFMPIFDWTRSNLFHEVGDGSTALFYEKGMIQDDYKAMADYILGFTEKYNMSFPGWEPERMAKLDELFKAYEGVTHEKLWANLKYFLDAIMPTCHECDVKMAIHMDDPPCDIFGIPRLLINEERLTSSSRWLTIRTTALLSAPVLSAQTRTTMFRQLSASIATESHLLTSETSRTSRTATSPRHRTATATATRVSLKSLRHTMTADLKDISVPTTADTSGMRVRATSAPATVFTTVRSVSCICTVSGIRSTASRALSN